MKIIDNKKDYYDYLSGKYGIDDKVVYDRRGSMPSSEIVDMRYDRNPFFNTSVMDTAHGCRYDSYDEKLPQYDARSKEYYSYSDFLIIIEAGMNHYCIKVERFRTKESDPISIRFTGMTDEEYWKDRKESMSNRWRLQYVEDERQKLSKKLSSAPLAIIFCNSRTSYAPHSSKPVVFDNPILKDIPGIPGKVDPEWIWQSLYEYISSLNDKQVTDSRTDIEHLESAGFDRKTSFRNIK